MSLSINTCFIFQLNQLRKHCKSSHNYYILNLNPLTIMIKIINNKQENVRSFL